MRLIYVSGIMLCAVACINIQAMCDVEPKIKTSSIQAKIKKIPASIREEDLKRISSYIGSHSFTNDYPYQEGLRRLDLWIVKQLESSLGKKKADTLFINGWGQIISAVALLSSSDDVLSPEFKKIVEDNVAAAFAKAEKSNNPFMNVNVREQAKNIMMYPHAGKFVWREVKVNKILDILNENLKNCDMRFALFEGKGYLRIFSKDGATIFEKLWSNDFENLLKESDFHGMKPNVETPHLTLINSNVIAAMQDKFKEKYGAEGAAKFEAFFNNWLEAWNKKLDAARKDIKFVVLSASHPEDYSPFGEVVVAQMQAPVLHEAVKDLASQVKTEVGYSMAVPSGDLYHLTVAINYRKPYDLAGVTVNDLLQLSERYKDSLIKYFDVYLKA